MNGNGNSGIITHITSWLKQPFNAQGDVLSWTLFLGLVLVVTFFWTRVLQSIEH
jgi:hypothetical protein